MPVLSKDRDLMPEKSLRGKSITRAVFIRGEVDSRVKAVIFIPWIIHTFTSGLGGTSLSLCSEDVVEVIEELKQRKN